MSQSAKERKYARIRIKKRADGSVMYRCGTYDWRTNDTLTKPPLSCRWGPVMMRSKSIARQRLYLSYKESKCLVVAECLVFMRPVFSDVFENEITEQVRSPYIRECKTIIAPGKVGRIRELPWNMNMVATLSDSRVHIWDIGARCEKSGLYGTGDSRQDLELSGREDKAEFAALALSRDCCVLSGGKDKHVSLWNIQDHTTSAAAGHVLPPRDTYLGHRDTVKDVQFHPSSSQQFCSVGDDSCLLLWDARAQKKPVSQAGNAHGGAFSVDWNRSNEAKILTGSDNSVKLFDRRLLNTPAVIIDCGGGCVQWCPDKESVAGISSADGTLNVWNLEMDSSAPNSCTPDLFKDYAGHRGGKIVDFHWNEFDPYTIASLSDDSETHGGGVGKLQIWRLSGEEYKRFVKDVVVGQSKMDAKSDSSIDRVKPSGLSQ